MNITAEKFEAMKIAYDMAFKDAFTAAPSVYEQFCMIVGDSAHTTIKLPFMEQFTCMRKWLGPRQIKNLEGKMITMTEDATRKRSASRSARSKRTTGECI